MVVVGPGGRSHSELDSTHVNKRRLENGRAG